MLRPMRGKSLTVMLLALLSLWQPPLGASDMPQEPRDYYTPLSARDEHNIQFLINTMAEKSPISLWLFHRKSLEAAGRETIHLHPLALLSFISADSNLHRQCRRINGVPWKLFQKYMTRSLKAANKRENLPPEVVKDFAERVGMPAEALSQDIANENWSKILNAIR